VAVFLFLSTRLAYWACQAASKRYFHVGRRWIDRLDLAIILNHAAMRWADPGLAHRVQFNTGALYIQGASLARRYAVRLLQESAESSDAEIAARSWLNLGVLYERVGTSRRSRSAEVAYSRGVKVSVIPYSEECRNNLGITLAIRGDAKNARATLRRTVRSGVEPAASVAAFNLGVLLSSEGRIVAARDAYQRAGDSSRSEVSLYLTTNLSEIDGRDGETLRQMTFRFEYDYLASPSPYLCFIAGMLPVGKCGPAASLLPKSGGLANAISSPRAPSQAQ
jgi:Tfp pilus assembly protein PilF